MAEPVLISYARGLLREFPGVPEGTIDVIPVDLVVAAIITVAALGPEAAPAISQVASGGINPLKYRVLVDNVSDWFTQHPLYDAEGQPIVVPEFRFPARGRVQSQLHRAKSLITRGEQVLQALPLRGKQAEFSARLESKRVEVERALEYVELYGLYSECEAIYQVDHLMAMWERLSPDDQREFGFDPRAIDWPTYIRTVHLPSIVQHAPASRRRRRRRPPTARTGFAARSCHLTGQSPPSTSRTRSSPATSSRATRGWRHAGSIGVSARATHCGRWPRRQGCCVSIASIVATSCATSIADTRTRRSSRSAPTPTNC